MDDSTSTRDKLLDAAARLFAERGIDNVSIREIVRTAGQHNASAVHYHFGSRGEVLRAVLARHVPAIAGPPPIGPDGSNRAVITPSPTCRMTASWTISSTW